MPLIPHCSLSTLRSNPFDATDITFMAHLSSNSHNTSRHCLPGPALCHCAPTSVLEDELEVLEDDEDPDWEDDEEMRAWDTYVIDIDSD